MAKKQIKQARQTKSTNRASKTVPVACVHSRRDRAFGFIGLILLFVCGFVLGYFSHGAKIKHQPQSQNRPVVMVSEGVQITAPTATCETIEELLYNRLNSWDENALDSYTHIQRAEIYANMSIRGCPENSETYRQFAVHEIDIARALNDDGVNSHGEVIEMVETYKKLNMKAEAEKVIEKVRRITNPAIDFIYEVERIINE